MKGKRAKINSIMLQTDFRAIKDFFLTQDITWKIDEGEEYVPSVQEIEAKAKEMLETATKTPSGYYKSVSGNMMVRKSNVGLEFGVFVSYKWA